MKIESIKDYINILSEEELKALANKIYKITEFVEKDYPNHKNWFFNIQLKETLDTNTRNILFVRDKDKIIGVANLLSNDEEKKISTLYVIDEYRNKGIGTQLIEESMKWLKTRYPIISMTKDRYELYKPIIDKYNWKLTRILNGFYKEGMDELFFNVPEDNNIYR